MRIWRLQGRHHVVDGLHAKLHEVGLIQGVTLSSSLVLGRVRHELSRHLSRCCTITQVYLWWPLGTTTRKICRVHVHLLREIERLHPPVVSLGLLEASLGLVALVDRPTRHAGVVPNGAIQNIVWTDVPVVKLILHIGYLVLGRVGQASDQLGVGWTGDGELVVDVEAILQHGPLEGLRLITVEVAGVALAPRPLVSTGPRLVSIVVVIGVVPALPEILQLPLVLLVALEVLVDVDARGEAVGRGVVDGPVGFMLVQLLSRARVPLSVRSGLDIGHPRGARLGLLGVVFVHHGLGLPLVDQMSAILLVVVTALYELLLVLDRVGLVQVDVISDRRGIDGGGRVLDVDGAELPVLRILLTEVDLGDIVHGHD